MRISPAIATATSTAASAAKTHSSGPKPPHVTSPNDNQYRKAFDSFVGEVFFGQMLKAMRKTLAKPAYFHGGRAEEIFQQQLDQVLAEKLTNASAEKFSDPLFKLANMKR